jgi:branched-chain amino acid transport system permease protein
VNYVFHLLVYLGIYSIVAQSLNFVVGYCGYLSLAHAGYFAIGAYAYAIATMHGVNGFAAIIVAALLGAVFSFLVSLPTWRVKGDLFVMASLAVQAFIFSGIYNWSSLKGKPGTWLNLTNGPYGLAGIGRPAMFGIVCDTIGSMAVFSLGSAAICFWMARMLHRSPWRRALEAMRDDEMVARSLGKNVRRLKVEAFAWSCAMVAASGAIYGAYVSFIDPSLASLDESILVLAMVLIGGAGNVWGPIVGALTLLALPEIFRLVHFPDSISAELRMLAYGVLLIALTHLRPQGLAGEYRFR